ncbi:CHAT domain-containing protein [Streptomyces polygonati]|uniref:CHAT domain-containing protein n=1 Tax=Streptomyces polygonati TaxID=1617087 RepID=A0ABV8HSN1_9ACTN
MAVAESAADLTLELADFRASDEGMSWRWVLTGAGGVFEADARIRLDRLDWQYDAFEDLYGYLGWRVDPARRIAGEAGLVRQVGEWIGSRVLAGVGVRLLEYAQASGGCLVRVVLPPDARIMALRPLEAAVVNGAALALARVVFRHEVRAAVGGGSRASKHPVGDALRILALFSLPDSTTALNLRRERHELARLVHTIGAVHNRAVELQVLQYGVTREQLEYLALEGLGWDIIHISGHGGQGTVTLENEDGSPDTIQHDELVALLAPLRRHVKLITASSCSSADALERDPVELPGLGPAVRTEPRPGTRGGGMELSDLASALAGSLECAVVGMRFPVVDDFAIAFVRQFYELLLALGQPPAAAFGLTLSRILPAVPTASFPALSAGTPALFDASAAGIALTAPRGGALVFDQEKLRMAGFPGTPERFVGRVALMTRANTALAPHSGVSGVVLYGMAGSGKTTAALELAYTQERRFRALVWVKVGAAETAVGHREDIAAHVVSGALTDLAVALEQRLAGLSMTPALTDDDAMARLLPLLTEFFERERVLLVVDNAESLFTADGVWRDRRWRLVFEALTAHTGFSRVVLTSRVRPAAIGEHIVAEPVHALGLREAVLLARELPHLGRLIEGTAPGVDAEAGRQVVSEVLAAAQGHPELLVLADAQAEDRTRLDALLETARHIWAADRRDTGDHRADTEPPASAEDYAAVLDSWTRGIAGHLPGDERLLFHLLSLLEEPDRTEQLVGKVWRALLDSPVTPAAEGARPSGAAVPTAALVRSGLVARTSADGGRVRLDLHPSVAGVGRNAAAAPLTSAVDRVLAGHWCDVLEDALADEDSRSTGALVLSAGRAACPYLLRLGDWERLADVVSRVLTRDVTRPTALALLPFLEEALTLDGASDRELRLARTHARLLIKVAPEAGERRLEELFARAVRIGQHDRAANLASDLRSRYRDTGRLSTALGWARQAIDHAELSGQGPWTLMGIEASRVQLLSFTGRSEEALAEAQRLLGRSAELPRTSDATEGVEPWAAEEMLLDIARMSSRDLGRFTEALELNRRIAASEKRRGASSIEQTHTLFNTAELLLRLDRLDESAEALQTCRQEYERQSYPGGLAWTFTAFAQVERRRGHHEAALELARSALRYAYQVRLTADIAVAHHDMGTLLREHAGEHSGAAAHHLAAALIRVSSGLAWGDESIAAAVEDARSGPGVPWPASVTELAERVAEVPGVDLPVILGIGGGEDGDPAADDVQRAWESLMTAVRSPAGSPDGEASQPEPEP